MNNKGQAEKGLGLLIITAVAIIVGVIFFQAVAQQAGASTDLVVLNNQSVGAVSVNGTGHYLTNCKELSDVIVFNATGDGAVNTGNYTVTNNVVHNGALTVEIMPTISATPKAGYERGVWTVDAVCQPLGYIPEAGGRAMVGLIAIFFALAIAVVALTPVLRQGFLDLVGV